MEVNNYSIQEIQSDTSSQDDESDNASRRTHDNDFEFDGTRLLVKLETTEQINEALHDLEEHYKTIEVLEICAENKYEKDFFNIENATTIQQNLLHFLQVLACKAKSQTLLPNVNEIYFNGQFIVRLIETNLLAKIIKSKSICNFELIFNCHVSMEGFLCLISEFGSKRINRSHNREPKSQKRHIISGMGINCNHVKRLENLLLQSLISSLILRETRIKDDGASALATMLCQNTTLMVLDLSYNKIDVLGAQALGKMLCQNSSLQSIDLSFNKIGDDGVTSIAESLSVNSTLKDLCLSKVGCHSKGLLALAGVLTQNTTLKELDLSFNEFHRDDLDGVEALAQTMKLNNSLTKLNLGRTLTKFPPNVAQILAFSFADKTSKFELDLSMSHFIHGDTIVGFAECHSPLLTLDLGFSRLRPHHFEAFAHGIQSGKFNVQSLNLSHAEINNECVVELFKVLIEKKSSCSLVGLSLEYLRGMTEIGAQFIVDAIPLTNLRSLYLSEIPIGDDGVQQIASYLNDTTLTELGLDGVGMQDSGLIALSSALRHNTKITTLDIYGNPSITEFGKQALLETMRDYNMILKDICIGEENNIHNKQIKFYSALNCIKRRKIIDANLVSVALFPDILEDACEHPSMIYWILQSCPHIFYTHSIGCNH